MKFWYLNSLVLYLFLLTGCASAPHINKAPVVILDAHSPENSKNYKDESLYEKQLYQILLAETAYRRGYFETAVDSYLAVALASHEPAVSRRACFIALNVGDKDAGLQAAKRWVELAPDNFRARYLLALFYIQSRQIELALEHFKIALSSVADGGNGYGFSDVADLLVHELDGRDALLVMKELVADYSDNVDALVAYSRLALQTGELDVALSVVDRAFSLAPGRSDVLLLRVKVLQYLGDDEAAAEYLSSVVDERPDDMGLRKWYAQLLETLGRYEEAVMELKLVESRTPFDGEVIFSLGLLALNSQNWDFAREYMQKLLGIGMFRDEANYYLGWLAELDKDYSRAIGFYSSVNLGSVYIDAQIRLAYSTAMNGELNIAIGYLESLEVEDKADMERVFLVHGQLLREARRFDDAVEVYDRGLEILNRNHELLYARAMALEKLGEEDQMREDLRTIIADDPENSDALNALGYAILVQNGDLDEAKGYLMKALELNPHSYYIIDSVGWLYYRLGEYDKSIEYLRRAYELGGDSEVAAHLGEVLWASGDYDGARDVWNRALKNTPGHEVLLGVVERFSVR